MQAQSYFVMGTDTEVGKTYVASQIIRKFVADGVKTIGMKPIASGCELNAQAQWVNEDVLSLTNASNVSAPIDLINPYRFIPAIAPHLAAQAANVALDLDKIVASYQALAQRAQIVIVEAAGGFLVPINATQTMADLACQLNLPIILVVGMRLGCINHALLTVEAIKARGLTLAGWVANEIDPSMERFDENLQSLMTRIDAPLLMKTPWVEKA